MQQWEGFLPDNAIIMAKRGAAPARRTREPEVTPTQPTTLQELQTQLHNCTRCKLSAQGRRTIVFGEGNPHAELVFVGEAPGETEDLEGRPFVGKAGELLTKMIEAMGLSREKVYIANVIKCRPPGNRDPEPDEIAQCSPFLAQQLAAIRPKVIVALGKFAAQQLLQADQGILKIRGNWGTYNGIKVMPTFHPAYLLRTPAAKKEVWDDLKMVAQELGIEIPKK